MIYKKIKIPLTLALISCLSIPLSSCGYSDALTALKQKALPAIREYEHVSRDKFKVKATSKILIDPSAIAQTDLVKEFAKDFSNKLHFVNPLQDSTNLTSLSDGDIVVSIVPSIPKHTSVVSDEIYQIDVNRTITLKAKNYLGLAHGLTTILQMSITNDGVNYGTITDWPKTQDRGIQYDCSGRKFGIDFLKETIRQLSWSKLSALGLQIASGGCHVALDGVDSQGKSQTIFYIDGTPYNVNTNTSDQTPTWDWHDSDPTTEFGESMKLANDLGVKIIPQMEVLAHANFITDLTMPRDDNGNPKPFGDITPEERANDFALYDDTTPSPRRFGALVDLRGQKPGSITAIKLIKAIVTRFATEFRDKVGCDTFSIGADEYLEQLIWEGYYQRCTLLDSSKEDILNSFYSVVVDLQELIKGFGLSSRQWNDDLLRNMRDQEPNDWFPAPTQQQVDSLDKEEYIQYWWKGKPTDATYWCANALASIDDYVKAGYKNIVNYDFNDLYVCDDPYSSVMPNDYSLFNTWHPGMFPKQWEQDCYGQYQEYKEDRNGNYPSWLKGAFISVWSDWYPNLYQCMEKPLKALSQKCWSGSDYVGTWENYKETATKLGYAPFINYIPDA